MVEFSEWIFFRSKKAAIFGDNDNRFLQNMNNLQVTSPYILIAYIYTMYLIIIASRGVSLHRKLFTVCFKTFNRHFYNL